MAPNTRWKLLFTE